MLWQMVCKDVEPKGRTKNRASLADSHALLIRKNNVSICYILGLNNISFFITSLLPDYKLHMAHSTLKKICIVRNLKISN
jgi:hypothetical protein